MSPIPITKELVDALADAMPVGAGAWPESITGSVWPNGQWRGIRASYPNGWDLSVYLNKQGKVTSTKATMRMRVKVSG